MGNQLSGTIHFCLDAVPTWEVLYSEPYTPEPIPEKRVLGVFSYGKPLIQTVRSGVRTRSTS